MKKALKGFHKTRHFRERQKERNVTDAQIIKALVSGELKEIDFGNSFRLGDLMVTIDLLNSTLITVHPGDPASKKTKLLSKSEAKIIRQMILDSQPKSECSNDFLNYVTENCVKKID